MASDLNFFKSEDIKVFPCAYRGKKNDLGSEYFNPESIIQSEFNFTNTSNKHWKESYIISYNSTNNELACVIAGYYFKIRNLNNYTALTTNNGYLYIALADKVIGTSSDQTTTVLAYLRDYNSDNIGVDEYLDFKDESTGEYKFYGLGYSTAKITTPASLIELQVFESGHICYTNMLPEIAHGTTDKSSILPGGTKIAQTGANSYAANITTSQIDITKPVNIAANNALTIGANNNQTIIENGDVNTIHVNADVLQAKTSAGIEILDSKTSNNNAINVSDNGVAIAGNTTIAGATTVTGNTTIAGATTISGTAEVTGKITGTNGADVSGDDITLNAASNKTISLQYNSTDKVNINSSGVNISGASNINTAGTAAAPNSSNTTIGSAANYTGTTTIYGGLNIPGAIDISYDNATGTLTIIRGLNYPAQ